MGDLADLRAFCSIVDLGSITAAGRALRESKATVSRRLTRLESALGVTLIERTTRLVRATEEGVAYRERVGAVLELLGAANDAARHRGQRPSGVLRVTSGPELNALLAPVIGAFAAKYPAVRVEMRVSQSALDFDAEGLDVALRVAQQLPSSSLVAHKVLPLDVAFVASPAYVAAHGAPRAPADLARHRCNWLDRTPRALSLRHRRSGELAEIAVSSHIEANEMSFLVELAACGAGVTVLPRIAVRRRLDAGELVEVLGDYELPASPTLYLMHRASPFLPPKVRAFREAVLDALGPGRRRR